MNAVVFWAAGAAIIFVAMLAIVISLLVRQSRRRRAETAAENVVELTPPAADAEPAAETIISAESIGEEFYLPAQEPEALERALHAVGFYANVTAMRRGYGFTRYEIQPDAGERAGRIRNFTDDIALALGAADVLIHIPLPGKYTIGIDLPVRNAISPTLGEILRSGLIKKSSLCRFAVGMTVDNQIIISDMAQAGHVLITGAVGTGKSMELHGIAATMLSSAGKNALRLIIIDINGMEFTPYNGLPHLLMPVIGDSRTASGALGLAEIEMNERYRKLSATDFRNIDTFNDDAAQKGTAIMPRVVIFADNIADMLRENDEAAARLFNIIEKGAKVGVHVVMTVPLPCSGPLLERLALGIPSKITLHSPSKQASLMTIGSDDGARLAPVGDMLIKMRQPGYIEHVRGIYSDTYEVERLCASVRNAPN